MKIVPTYQYYSEPDNLLTIYTNKYDYIFLVMRIVSILFSKVYKYKFNISLWTIYVIIHNIINFTFPSML